ncbi:Pycsar system effector family protein [Streptomyces jumonjinensis]|uniref:Pycsar system effector family protein n=1 Tax=Streptomyces jumonjinensis TaxID=1945 RepID=UPI0037AA0C31
MSGLPLDAHRDRELDAAVSHTAGEVARTDQKAGLLLTLDGLLVAALSFLGADIDGVSLALALIGAAALVSSVVLALTVIRPQLMDPRTRTSDRTSDRTSFVFWAVASDDEITAGLAEDRRLARVRVLSRIALRKMRILRYATDASIAAVVAIAGAILTR